MKKMSLMVLGLIAILGVAGCSVADMETGFSANEVVVYNDGDLVITSEKTVFEVMPEGNTAITPKWNYTKNVWRFEQELRRYYRSGGTVYVSGQLLVRAGVNNIAYNKVVGIRYTKNNWSSFTDANGFWTFHNQYSNIDVFDILSDSNIQPGTAVKYAIYYKVNGATYWDNNNGKNYIAQF